MDPIYKRKFQKNNDESGSLEWYTLLLQTVYYSNLSLVLPLIPLYSPCQYQLLLFGRKTKEREKEKSKSPQSRLCWLLTNAASRFGFYVHGNRFSCIRLPLLPFESHQKYCLALPCPF